MSRRAKLNVQMIGHTVFTPPKGLDGSLVFEPEGYTGEDLVVFSGRACYQSFDRPRAETATNKGYIRNAVCNQNHWSIAEHSSVSFYISGISRACSHELIRHRHFSYSQLSQRYVDAKDTKFVIPPLVEEMCEREIARLSKEEGFLGRFVHPETGNRYTPEAFLEVVLDKYVEKQFETAVTDYTETEDTLVEYFPAFKKKRLREAARSVLPNAAETRIVITGNYRAWAGWLIQRDSSAADREIRRLAQEVGRQLAEHAPSIFGDEARKLWDTNLTAHGESSR